MQHRGEARHRLNSAQTASPNGRAAGLRSFRIAQNAHDDISVHASLHLGESRVLAWIALASHLFMNVLLPHHLFTSDEGSASI